MTLDVANLGRNLENLVDYDWGSFPALRDSGESRHFLTSEALHTSTSVYKDGDYFKVDPVIDLHGLKDPNDPDKLIIPEYNDVQGDSVKEFAIVKPTDNPEVEYAVLIDDPRYTPGVDHDEANLRYFGSPLGTYLDTSDARRHKVLMAAFDSKQAVLQQCLKDLEDSFGSDLKIKVNISDSMFFSTVSLSWYRKDNVIVIGAKYLGRKFIHHLNK